MTEISTNSEASEASEVRLRSPSQWAPLVLGIGNFFLVTVLGAYTSWWAQDLESKLSTVQTAAQYIEIVADESAPDYAKGMALNAIFHQGLISKDRLLDAAYRIEDDSLERTMVGQIFYQMANIEARLLAPFGYIEDVKVHQKDEEHLQLVVRGWGIDDGGWIPGETDGRNLYLVVELNDELVCSFPIAEEADCDVTFVPRPDISAAFSQYPRSNAGFDIRLPMTQDAQWAQHLVIALRDEDHRGRIIYSRCVALKSLGPLKVGQERRLKESKYDGSCGHLEDNAS